MQDTDLFRRAEELWRRSADRSIVSHTSFLTPAEQFTLERQAHLRPALYLFGGAADCERRVAFFLPEYLPAEAFDPQEYLSAIHIRCRKNYQRGNWFAAIHA